MNFVHDHVMIFGVTVQRVVSREVKIALYAILRGSQAPNCTFFAICVHPVTVCTAGVNSNFLVVLYYL